MDVHDLKAGTPVVVGDHVVELPQLKVGDRLIAVGRTGELLVVSAEDDAVVEQAVEAASGAFEAMSEVSDEAISSFFETFAELLADDTVWARVIAANDADVERAHTSGRSTARLVATAKMRTAMVEGLQGWARARSRRGEILETRDAGDHRLERRVAALGVVAFVFEGRPNVFADGAGVLRGANTAVMRIGSDALGTAIAIEESALRPALASAGLPEAAVVLVRSRSHGAAHALFGHPKVRLAIARGSGRSVALLGSIAEQHGITASLHGTGGAWVYAAPDADHDVIGAVVSSSLDRKVCNTLNVLLATAENVDVCLQALGSCHPDLRLHLDPSMVGHATSGQPIARADLGTEWEWEQVPEVSVALVSTDDEAIDMINALSPRFVASILTSDARRFERFYARTDVPYVGNGFTRWVDGQWAWQRPELGLTNWERGRLMGRSAILAGDDVFSVRDVFVDTTGRAPQRR